MERENLIAKAKNMRATAYVPYSQFPVGAAIKTASGNIYTGCNIENAAYPVSCCAERVAIFKAVADGEQSFREMAVSAGTERPVPPCGSCRQVMSEFFGSDTTIYLTNTANEIKIVTMNDLLPFSFHSDDINTSQKRS
ncbi:cytidine deaminase [Lentibacillus halophilus]|uniref:Cytidine deaminase n=1 Tax=Lentibacillus halophilus TaxID=295065 RepID=A0ABN0ZEE6_9BACI